MIEIVRGDTSPIYKFRLKRKDEKGYKVTITDVVSEAWFTVKRDCCDSEVVIQKKLSDGGITYNEEDNYYRFQILPEDTCSLNYGTYGFDIAVKFAENDKHTPLNAGLLTVKKHFTHKNNE